MNVALVVVAGVVAWMLAGVALAAAIGPRLRGCAEAAGEVVAERGAQAVLGASRSLGRWTLPGSVAVVVFASSTGLAAAGVLPRPVQGMASTVLSTVGLDVPDVTGRLADAPTGGPGGAAPVPGTDGDGDGVAPAGDARTGEAPAGDRAAGTGDGRATGSQTARTGTGTERAPEATEEQLGGAPEAQRPQTPGARGDGGTAPDPSLDEGTEERPGPERGRETGRDGAPSGPGGANPGRGSGGTERPAVTTTAPVRPDDPEVTDGPRPGRGGHGGGEPVDQRPPQVVTTTPPSTTPPSTTPPVTTPPTTTPPTTAPPTTAPPTTTPTTEPPAAPPATPQDNFPGRAGGAHDRPPGRPDAPGRSQAHADPDRSGWSDGRGRGDERTSPHPTASDVPAEVPVHELP